VSKEAGRNAGFLFPSWSIALLLGNRKDKTMSKKRIWVSFPQGGIIPKEVIGEAEDLHVEAHKAVSVPERYGRHLIDDRFAVEAEPETVSKEDKAAEKRAAAERKAEEEKAASEKAAAEKLAEEQATAIAAAEKDVQDAQALVENAADAAAKAEAQQLLDGAEAKLVALKA
jgi:hypothetical protein